MYNTKQETNYLLACFEGFFAKISYSEEDKKWIGRILDVPDLVVFDGNTLEEALATFHNGILGYKLAHKPNPYHAQVLNMIRYGIEEPDFIDAARELLYSEETT